MCTVTKCDCASSDSGVWSVIVAFFTGLVFLARWVVKPLVKYVLAPATVVVAVLVWRWLSGADLTGRKRTATFRHGAVAPARPARRLARRINWAYWPGYQRAIVRWVLTALLAAAWLYPVATALAMLSIIAAAVAARYRETIRLVIRRTVRPDVIRVRATVEHRPTAALTAHADVPLWSSAEDKAAAR